MGSLLGAVLMALVSLPSNYFVVYPAYEVLYRSAHDGHRRDV